MRATWRPRWKSSPGPRARWAWRWRSEPARQEVPPGLRPDRPREAVHAGRGRPHAEGAREREVRRGGGGALSPRPERPPRRQQLRGTLMLPHGTGKDVLIAVFAEGEKAKEAQEAGADVVGSADLATRIEGGFDEFDVAIATPDQM